MCDREQVGGDHYLTMDVTPWEVIEYSFNSQMYKGYLAGNIVKYLMRDGAKDALGLDERKAKHYAEKYCQMFGGDPDEMIDDLCGVISNTCEEIMNNREDWDEDEDEDECEADLSLHLDEAVVLFRGKRYAIRPL